MTTVDEKRTGIWVRSDLSPDGAYLVTVEINDDLSIPLSDVAGVAYAMAVITACEEADYDAAVLAQMTALGMHENVVLHTILDLRRLRPDPDLAATAPVRWVPIVSAKNRTALLHLHVGDSDDPKPYSQIDTVAAREHAMYVLECLAAVRLDTDYYRYLTTTVGLTDEKARTVVHMLAEHRTEGHTE